MSQDNTANQSSTDARNEAETIASENANVRERIRKTVVDTVRNRNVGLGAVADVTREVVDGAAQGVREMTPENRESVLRQVVDGLSDAFTSTAQATRLAMEEAQGRGERFAKEDVQDAIKHLSEMQKLMTDTILDTFEKARIEASGQTKDFIEHARRASERVQPSIEQALHAATHNPVKLATETASATAKGAPKAAGTLLHAMSGMLQGAGDLLTGAGRASEPKSEK